MKSKFEIVRFEQIPTRSLEPHPDAELPIDEKDLIAMSNSVMAHGVFLPLLVEAKTQKNGTIRILDGVNRWKAAMKAGIETMPCILVNCEDPRALALECLANRRKCSAGQRVLAFLEMHRREVLKVAELVGDGRGNIVPAARQKLSAGHVTRRENPEEFDMFTAEAIAVRLGVSDKDVKLGIELLECLEEKRRPTAYSNCAQPCGGKPLNPEDEDDKEYLKQMRGAWNNIFTGTTPIRRWKCAVGSRAKTAGKERADTNYTDLARRTFASLRTILRHWAEIPSKERQQLAEQWDALMDLAKQNHL